jgi:hypothetical protein
VAFAARFYLPLIFVALTASMVLWLAFSQAEAIKQGEQPMTTIHPKMTVQYRQFSDSAGQVTEKDLTLVGSTLRVTFFYDLGAKAMLVIPHSQIVAMKVSERDVKLPGQEE